MRELCDKIGQTRSHLAYSTRRVSYFCGTKHLAHQDVFGRVANFRSTPRSRVRCYSHFRPVRSSNACYLVN
jgi:hypothetical protein